MEREIAVCWGLSLVNLKIPMVKKGDQIGNFELLLSLEQISLNVKL
ncbi:hypothetical protein AVEN_245168-1, partial [Araneus ventricosus]